MKMPNRRNIWLIVRKIVFPATVYFIWQERNMRLFGGFSRTVDELFKTIVEAVRLRIMGLKLKITSDVIKAPVTFKKFHVIILLFTIINYLILSKLDLPIEFNRVRHDTHP